MKILAIDGSSSVAGIAIFNSSGDLEYLGYYSLNKKKSLLDRFEEFEEFLSVFCEEHKPTHMVIERSYEAMYGAQSSSYTTALLNQANILYQYICKKLGLIVSDMAPDEARKKALPGFSFKRKGTILTQKEQAFEKVKELIGENYFPKKILKSGKRKGQEVFIDEATDMSDAYVIGRAFYLTNNES